MNLQLPFLIFDILISLNPWQEVVSYSYVLSSWRSVWLRVGTQWYLFEKLMFLCKCSFINTLTFFKTLKERVSVHRCAYAFLFYNSPTGNPRKCHSTSSSQFCKTHISYHWLWKRSKLQTSKWKYFYVIKWLNAPKCIMSLIKKSVNLDIQAYWKEV